jgi:hypothetical protein
VAHSLRTVYGFGPWAVGPLLGPTGRGTYGCQGQATRAPGTSQRPGARFVDGTRSGVNAGVVHWMAAGPPRVTTGTMPRVHDAFDPSSSRPWVSLPGAAQTSDYFSGSRGEDAAHGPGDAAWGRGALSPSSTRTHEWRSRSANCCASNATRSRYSRFCLPVSPSSSLSSTSSASRCRIGLEAHVGFRHRHSLPGCASSSVASDGLTAWPHISTPLAAGVMPGDGRA